ncbi:reticulon-like protein B17 isoform X1 [Sesamum indicum]|uniref:Reticulon-like protein n=1 Tax=Sesamum indicum TaxID=4182 RepID=A0A8M8VFQ0_SESIN|nr:reticulon-like protein B17 isoform X1 [Sesamum indicum]
MDSTPPSLRSEPRTRTKSASRLSKLRHYSDQAGGGSPIPQLSLEIVPSSPKISTPSPASTISPRPPYTLPLQELLMLSPSPLKRSKARLGERLEMADDVAVEACGVRKRCKSRSSAAPSPRSSRRSRRRVEQDMREERESVAGEEIWVKPRKKRHSERSRKDKSISVPPVLSLNLGTSDGDGCNMDAIGEMVNDLVMWKDVSKSSLWFGFGSLCFLSSCFTRGINFSIFSFLSQVGLLFLGVSFFSNTMRQRDGDGIRREIKLKEDDILRVGRLVLPAANLAISRMREVFSGEPAMTLKVVPFLLVGAEYGHLITLWRLCALGFFISFTAPKLYSAYSSQLSKKVEHLKSWALNAWESCTHKKVVAASAVTAFWNLTSIRTRIFAAFLCLVILRYRRQQTEAMGEEDAAEGKEEQQQEKALVAVEIESKN